jgi:hypothetical protein
MSLPPNWTPLGTEPAHDAASSPAASTACRHVGLIRPESDGLIGRRARSNVPPGATVARVLWAAPLPSCGLTGTGSAPEPARFASAGTRAPMSF